jgi:hypothetical protein
LAANARLALAGALAVWYVGPAAAQYRAPTLHALRDSSLPMKQEPVALYYSAAAA